LLIHSRFSCTPVRGKRGPGTRSGREQRRTHEAAYFDLTVHDLGRAKAFFEEVLGWQFRRFDMPYEYFRIQAGPATEAGIDGGIGAIRDAPLCGGLPMTQVTIPVDDLDRTLALVTAAGGTVVESKMPIPGIGWYATCAEPGGLRFGLIQGDPGTGRSGAVHDH
jgi:hypothetical protein